MPVDQRKRLELEEVRRIQERLLTKFALFCETHGLQYMLACGTLLGAIRHGGFIPWDDDIDVMMPRSDYERLIQLRDQLEAFAHAKLRYSTGVTDPYPFPYAKLLDPRTTLIEHHRAAVPLGVNIDIFPLDGWPQHRVRRAFRRAHLTILMDSALIFKSWTPSMSGRFPAIVYRVGQLLMTAIPMGLVIRRVTKIASLEPLNESMFAGIVVSYYREVVKVTDLLPRSQAIFEGREYCVPSNPHEVLSAIFGDYMKLPPIEERISHHKFDAYYLYETS